MVSEELGTAVTRSMLSLARSLKEHGHDVVVAVLSAALAGRDPDPDGVPVITPSDAVQALEGDARARGAWLGAVAARLEPDVVHVHGAEAMLAAAAMPPSDGTVVVATLPLRAATGLRSSSAAASLAAHAMIAPSGHEAAQLQAATGCDPAAVHVIPPAVMLGSCDGGARRLPRPGRMIGAVSDLVAGAGVDAFIRAAARLSTLAPDVTYVVVGDGPERPALEDLAERLEIRSRIGFLHERSDMSGLLRRLDVLCLPGASEATPYAALEAMALGTPIVAADVGGIEDIARPGREALLVAEADDKAMAAQACALLEHRLLAWRLAWAARRRVRHHFSVARVSALHESLYIACGEANAVELKHAEPLQLAVSA
jgi:glycosyltransferase involved in cell wall biosynthesis